MHGRVFGRSPACTHVARRTNHGSSLCSFHCTGKLRCAPNAEEFLQTAQDQKSPYPQQQKRRPTRTNEQTQLQKRPAPHRPRRGVLHTDGRESTEELCSRGRSLGSDVGSAVGAGAASCPPASARQLFRARSDLSQILKAKAESEIPKAWSAPTGARKSRTKVPLATLPNWSTASSGPAGLPPLTCGAPSSTALS